LLDDGVPLVFTPLVDCGGADHWNDSLKPMQVRKKIGVRERKGIGLPPAPMKKTRRMSLGPAGPPTSSPVMSLRRR